MFEIEGQLCWRGIHRFKKREKKVCFDKGQERFMSDIILSFCGLIIVKTTMKLYNGKASSAVQPKPILGSGFVNC